MADSETANNRWRLLDYANTILTIVGSLIVIGGAIYGLTIFVVAHISAASGKPGAGHGSPTATSSGGGLYAETTGGETHTWTKYLNAGG